MATLKSCQLSAFIKAPLFLVSQPQQRGFGYQAIWKKYFAILLRRRESVDVMGIHLREEGDTMTNHESYLCNYHSSVISSRYHL